MNQGTLYPALLRLEQRGWIASRWGLSAHNRRRRLDADLEAELHSHHRSRSGRRWS